MIYVREERKCPGYWDDYKDEKLLSRLVKRVELFMREVYVIKLMQEGKINLETAAELIGDNCGYFNNDYINQVVSKGYELDTFLLFSGVVRKRILYMDELLSRGLSAASAFEILRQRNHSKYFHCYSSCELEKQRRYTIRYLLKEMDNYGCIEVDGEVIKFTFEGLLAYVLGNRRGITIGIDRKLGMIIGTLLTAK